MSPTHKIDKEACRIVNLIRNCSSKVLVSVVTDSQIMRTMSENIISFVDTYITDPRSGDRTQKKIEIGDSYAIDFCRLESGGSPYPPQIIIQLPRSPAQPADTSATHNKIYRISFGILGYCRDVLEAIDLSDELVQAIHDNGTFFENTKMWRPTDYSEIPGFYPHESNPNEHYFTLTLTFHYFHY